MIHRWRITGVVMLVMSITVWVWVEFIIIRPALMPQADGTFGEMYGPVSELRGVFNVICGITAITGGLIAGFVSMLAPRSNPQTSTCCK